MIHYLEQKKLKTVGKSGPCEVVPMHFFQTLGKGGTFL
jgi:hypothetical protein